MRLTKIICTVGPSSKTTDDLAALAAVGMNVARINLSHGTTEQHRSVIRTIRELNAQGSCIAVMADTKGAEIRTGDVQEPLTIAQGQEVLFTPRAMDGGGRPVLLVNYDSFAKDVQVGQRILLDNGEMSFDVIGIAGPVVTARAREAGKVGSRRHVNLPGAMLSLPSLTEKDWQDLAFCIEEGVDVVALSFINDGDTVRAVKAFLRENGSAILVIAKIETQRAVDAIDDILEASDGIMIARGDLGAEIPFEQVPAIQDDIVRSCRRRGKPVIVATHMLESMIEHPIPTRAEVTDVAHAATTLADCTMLSAETSVGRHPLTALSAMDRILRETESHRTAPPPPDGSSTGATDQAAGAEAAVTMAAALRAGAIVVLTKTGRSAQQISRCRPVIPVIALTDTPDVQRQMQLLFGVVPLRIPFSDDPEATVHAALTAIREQDVLPAGTQVVLVSDMKTDTGTTSGVQTRALP